MPHIWLDVQRRESVPGKRFRPSRLRRTHLFNETEFRKYFMSGLFFCLESIYYNEKLKLCTNASLACSNAGKFFVSYKGLLSGGSK